MTNAIQAWLNVSKNVLKSNQTETLTVEFSSDPGALSLSNFIVHGGSLSNLGGSGLERTITFTAGPDAGAASISINSNAQGPSFQTFSSSPLTIISNHTIGVAQVDHAPTPSTPPSLHPVDVPGVFTTPPVLSGHADPGSTVRVLIQSKGNQIASPNDLSKLVHYYSNVTSDAGPDPLGGKTADLLQSTLSSGSTFVEAFQNTNIVKGQVYTLSAYVKANGSNYVQVVGNAASFGSFYVNFDLSVGAKSATSPASTPTNNGNGIIRDASIQSAGDGWYRISVSAEAIDSNSSNHMSLGIVKSPTSTRGDGALAPGSGLYVWDVSFEQAAQPAPLIATVTTGPDGVWRYTPTTSLPEGAYTVSATETAGSSLGAKAIDALPKDANGLTTMTIDHSVIAPVVSVSSSEHSAPVITGTAEKQAIVDVTFKAADGESHAYKVQAALDGSWKVDTSSAPLTGGKTWSVVAHQTDAAGNVSSDSAPQTVTSPSLPKQDILSGQTTANATVKLVFEHASNILFETNDVKSLSGSNWSASVDVAVDPLGGRTADKLVSTNANGGAFVEVFHNANIVQGLDYTLSAYVKADGTNFTQIVGNSAAFGTFNVNFDLAKGIVSLVNQSNGHILGSGMDSVGGGWYRVWVSAEAIGSNSSNHMSLGLINSATSARGDGAAAANSGLLVWGFNFEQSKSPAPVLATVLADATGHFSYNAGSLADGDYSVAAHLPDGSADAITQFNVANGVVSTPPVAPTLKEGDANHVDNAWAWTSKHDVTVQGVGVAGATITIYEAMSTLKGADGHGDRIQLGVATVGQDGHWSFQANLSEGEHTVYSEQTINGVTDTSIEKIIFPGYIDQSHRDWGNSGIWSQAKPEETIVAAENVVAQNLDVTYFDGDTRETKDGVLVLLHDGSNVNYGTYDWNRTTGGVYNGSADSLTYAQTYDLTVGLNIGQQAKPATFEELVAYAKSTGMKISMEVRSPDQCIAAMEIVERYGMVQNVILNSFNSGDLSPALQIDSQARLCLITNNPVTPDNIATVQHWGPNGSIIANYSNLTAQVVAECKNAGVPLGVWTPTSNATIQDMLALGVTTFDTDGPVTSTTPLPVLHVVVDTQVAAPTFTITPDAANSGSYHLQGMAEAFARVDVYDSNGHFLTTVQSEGGGLWNATLSIDPTTTYLQARQTDEAGNESSLSNGVLLHTHVQLTNGMLSPKALTAPINAYPGGANAIAVGDFNHDGILDYAVKTSNSVVIKAGGSDAALATLSTDAIGGTVGSSIIGLGDVNGDGFSDVIIGSSDGSGFNVAFVLLGSAMAETPVSTVQVDGGGTKYGYSIRAEESGVETGWVVAAAGDVNGDGLNDMIVTAQNGNANAGEVYVVFGKTDADTVYLRDVALGKGGFVIDGVAGSHAGATAFGAGDLNGDGFADIVVGDSANHQYVVYGGPQFITQPLINGSTGDDHLIGTSAGEVIVGGQGNDVIDGAGGADVLLGGDGDDSFIVGAAMMQGESFARIDGGAGYNTLELQDGVVFDLSKIMNVAANQTVGGNKVANIERIDMAYDVLHDEIDLSAASVLAAGGQMTFEGSTFAHGLVVDGGANDVLHLRAADGWRIDSTVHDPVYDVYAATDGARLLVNHLVHAQFDLA